MITSSILVDKRVAVIGANGYLGSSLVSELIKKQYKVTRVSKKMGKTFPNSFALIGDLCEANFCETILENNETIYLLSGNTSVKDAENDPKKNLMTTVSPIINLINAARKLKKIPRIVFASTATVYGITPKLPVKESLNPRPVTNYDLHKFFGEQQLELASKLGYIQGISLRLANVYGPSTNNHSSGDRGIVNQAAHTAIHGKDLILYGGGKFTRDYIYISDAIDAMCKVGASLKNTSGAFNVASGVGTELLEIYKVIVKEVKRKTGQNVNIMYKSWPSENNIIDQRNFVADVTKLNTETEWVPKIDVIKGINLLISSLILSKI
jgi:UDP-glucose 4-epimerase